MNERNSPNIGFPFLFHGALKLSQLALILGAPGILIRKGAVEPSDRHIRVARRIGARFAPAAVERDDRPPHRCDLSGAVGRQLGRELAVAEVVLIGRAMGGEATGGERQIGVVESDHLRRDDQDKAEDRLDSVTIADELSLIAFD
ncbi:MAG: hypothetical protein ABI626_10660 [Sphingomicrobium sp.]